MGGGGLYSRATSIQRNTVTVLCMFAGDFNSLPSSGVIQFLLESRIPFSHPDFKQIEYKHFFDEISTSPPSPTAQTPPSGDENSSSSSSTCSKMSHPYKLASAYPCDRDDCYTNYTYDFKGYNPPNPPTYLLPTTVNFQSSLFINLDTHFSIRRN